MTQRTVKALRPIVLHAFFLVTNLGRFYWPPEKVMALYRKRGSAEAQRAR